MQGESQKAKKFWLTPGWLLKRAAKLLGTTTDKLFDPARFPRPDPSDFDGLKEEWGQFVYLNPPFFREAQLIDGEWKMTPKSVWIAKAINESRKGKAICLVMPVDREIHSLVKAGAELISVGDVQWISAVDGSQNRGCSRPIMAFILRSTKPPSPAKADNDSLPCEESSIKG